MERISPCLWFDGVAEEAASMYVGLFPDSEVLEVTRAGGDTPSNAAGDVMLVRFRLRGQTYTALNGGPMFQFSEAVSFAIECSSQEEADHYWDALCDGGEPGRCGWLKDRFVLSWQVIPPGLGDWLGGPDAAGAGRAMQAMLGMSRLDIAALRAAYEGRV